MFDDSSFLIGSGGGVWRAVQAAGQWELSAALHDGRRGDQDLCPRMSTRMRMKVLFLYCINSLSLPVSATGRCFFCVCWCFPVSCYCDDDLLPSDWTSAERQELKYKLVIYLHHFLSCLYFWCCLLMSCSHQATSESHVKVWLHVKSCRAAWWTRWTWHKLSSTEFTKIHVSLALAYTWCHADMTRVNTKYFTVRACESNVTRLVWQNSFMYDNVQCELV